LLHKETRKIALSKRSPFEKALGRGARAKRQQSEDQKHKKWGCCVIARVEGGGVWGHRDEWRKGGKKQATHETGGEAGSIITTCKYDLPSIDCIATLRRPRLTHRATGTKTFNMRGKIISQILRHPPRTRWASSPSGLRLLATTTRPTGCQHSEMMVTTEIFGRKYQHRSYTTTGQSYSAAIDSCSL